MPPVLGVLLFVLLWAAVEVIAWVLRRRAHKSTPRLPASGSEALVPRRAPPPILGPRHAQVVLVHGFAGFDELRIAGRRTAYFRGVREALALRGVRCVVPRLPSVASIDVRARALAEQLGGIDGDLYVIAHSMGGLDARMAIARHRLANVRSLVTIATPHHGTPLAELGVRILRTRFAALERALRDLAPSRFAELDAEMAAVAGVHYASIVVAPRTVPVHPLLLPTHTALTRWAGDNDGIVPVSSQAWGDVLAHADTDHWGAVGWGSAFDAPAFYASIIERIWRDSAYPLPARGVSSRPWESTPPPLL